MARLQTLKLPKGVEIDEVSNDNFFTHPSSGSVPTTLAVKDYLHDEIDKHDQEFMPDGLYRNAIINGNFDIWQRGTSFNSSSYIADRWSCLFGGGSSGACTRQSSVPPTNSKYFVRIQRQPGDTTENGLYMLLYNGIETIDAKYFAGNPITVSFLARAGVGFSGPNNNLSLEIKSGTGIDEHFSGSGIYPTGHNATTFLCPLSVTWQRFSKTITLPSNATEFSFDFYYRNIAGTAIDDDYFDIAQVQLNIGDKPLPFSPRHPAEELALCQRYYYQVERPGAWGIIAMAILYTVGSPNGFRAIYSLPVQMRTTPTITTQNLYINVAGVGANVTASAIDAMVGNQIILHHAAVTGSAVGDTGLLLSNGSGNGRVTFSAEL